MILDRANEKQGVYRIRSLRQIYFERMNLRVETLLRKYIRKIESRS